ncbi:MAG: GNAT family N-acetyltransferase [Spirochaetaceae bacterium]|nr:MAG: GNAT family N-acetyltransferase [Spirochaetaceae bacterium]
MNVRCLHEKGEIESLLRRDLYLHLYSLGDLDDFFWPHTVWYAGSRDDPACPVVLLYCGQDPPTLLALHRDPAPMGKLLRDLQPLLPRRFQAHLSPGVENVFEESRSFRLSFHGEHRKMALTDPERVRTSDMTGTVPLTTRDREELLRFYRECYPDNWFDPRMLETGQYYGIREEGTLASVAGIHVYSPRYGVAALGNIATAPPHRNRGLAKRVTARVCRSLLEDAAGPIAHIGLNVKADNAPAIAGYRRLGFEIAHTYHEYVVEQR